MDVSNWTHNSENQEIFTKNTLSRQQNRVMHMQIYHDITNCTTNNFICAITAWKNVELSQNQEKHSNCVQIRTKWGILWQY